MTIYTAARMKDGVHYIASNITQCTKQLTAMKCTDFSTPTNYILIQKRLNSHLQFSEFGCRYETWLNRITATNRRRCRRQLDLPLLPPFTTCRFHIVPKAWYCLIRMLSNQTSDCTIIVFTDYAVAVIKY